MDLFLILAVIIGFLVVQYFWSSMSDRGSISAEAFSHLEFLFFSILVMASVSYVLVLGLAYLLGVM